MMKYPFEVDYKAIQANPDVYIDAVFSSLESEFLVLPKGPGFVDYRMFEAGYEALKQATTSFTNVTEGSVLPVVQGHPISMIVLRTILGFTPPEGIHSEDTKPSC
jgi:hypothetical protein